MPTVEATVPETPPAGPRLTGRGAHIGAILRLWNDVPGKAGMRALDVSAEEGRTARELLAMGMKVVATNYATRRDPALPAGAEFVGGVDLNQPFPFEDASFDAVNLKDVLEHLESPARTIREVARVLRPGGVAVITTPNPLHAGSRVRFALTGFMQGRKRPISYAKAPDEGGNLYTPPLHLLHYLLAQYGFKIEALALGRYERATVLCAIVFYPVFWLGAWLATRRVRKHDLLRRHAREKTSGAELTDMQRKQLAVNRRLRRLMLSREVLLGNNIIMRVRKTGGSPYDI